MAVRVISKNGVLLKEGEHIYIPFNEQTKHIYNLIMGAECTKVESNRKDD